MPKDAGGCESFSTSSTRDSILSRSARRASASFWFWPMARLSCSRVSTSFSSRMRDLPGSVRETTAKEADLLLQELHLGLELVHLLLVPLDIFVVVRHPGLTSGAER